MRVTSPSLIALALAFFCVVPPLSAEPISIGDPSFEDNSNEADDWAYELGPEWQETNGPDSSAGFEEWIPGFAAAGSNHLGMAQNHNVWQDLAVPYQAETRYTLTVAVGRRSGITQAGNNSVYELGTSDGIYPVAGGFDASTLPDQSFADAPPLVLDTTEFPEVVGKPIRIMLRARGAGRSHFDDIRLEAEPVAVPGLPTLGPLVLVEAGTTSAQLEGLLEDAGDGPVTLTLFWGETDAGLDAGAWERSQVLPVAESGPFAAELDDLEPGMTWFATARAANDAGVAWVSPALAFETPPAPPAVATLPAEEITATTARLRAEVTSTGGDIPEVTIFHGPADGGADPSGWAASAPLGLHSGTAEAAVTGLSPGSAYFFRAFAENSADGTWAPESSTFTTLFIALPEVVNLPPNGITGTTARLAGEVVSTGNDPPSVTIFFGTVDGGTNPGSWQFSANIGTSDGGFETLVTDLDPETVYFFRARATNAEGTAWAASSSTFGTLATQPGNAVINEFHYKPGDESTLGEFIELHNPGDADLDLAGWSLEDAITFTFPVGVVLPAGGFLVVAEDPATILAEYGVPALGPWSGKLSSRGETIDLVDANGILRDRVSYGVGFPWPSAPDGGGNSVELIHPALDRGLPGSWRASGEDAEPPAVYVPAGASGWNYRKGTEEASSPVHVWRATDFDDASWSAGTTPIGYGEPNIATELPDMRFNYSSVYFRREFLVPAGAVPERLRLRVAIDDGCVIWINGVEVVRRYVPQGELPYSSFASNHEQEWEEIVIEGADEVLFGGTNVVAVHGLNTTLNSSDFVFDLELSSADAAEPDAPTPGAANSAARDLAEIPPHFHEVAHSPQQPAASEAVTVSARITDADGVAAVTLSYQLVDPGSYIRLTDPNYETEWTDVPMHDNGTGGDAIAGDSIFTAVLPPPIQSNRRLVRYRIAAEDGLGNSHTVPYADDEQPNFAYYVYDGLPDWSGAFRPGQTPIETYPAETLGALPVYTLIAAGNDVIASQYNSGADSQRFPGTFVYDGVVYDHIEFRNRGEASTYVSGKNKWRFYFNRAHRLPAENNLGQDYVETWKQFSGDACASPWAALHRGSAGIEEAASYRIYQLAGIASPHTHYYHFRVVRGPEETPPAGTAVNDPIGNADGQYAGDFWGLYLAIEPVRGNFLDERGMPEGNLYKIEGNNGDKKEQAPGQPVDSSDWNAFRDAHVGGNPSEAWWRENMDMGAYYTFQALNRLTGNVDLRGGFNHYFYHRSSDDRWVPVPWDLDMMFIAKRHWTTNINGTAYPGVIHAHKSVLQNPALALEYRNRCREILDLLAGDAAPDGGQIGQLLAGLSAIVHPVGESLTWANADAAMWNLHPRTRGSDGNASGQTNHRGNFYRSPFEDSRMGGGWTRWLRSPQFAGTAAHEDSLEYFVNYATDTWPGGPWQANNGEQLGYGYRYLLSESADDAIPGKPTLSYLGEPGFPADGLTFAASGFTDPQGAGTFAARQWRIADVRAPGRFEIDALWTETDPNPADLVKNLPSVGIVPGRSYRVRVRQQDTSGRWSHWSDPFEFAAGQPAADLVHYWNFNDPSALLEPTFGAGASLAVSTAPPTEVRDDDEAGFSGENARAGDPAGTHLRVNNPLGASLTFHLPSTHYEKLIARVEIRRSGQGAGLQQWSYTTNGSDFLPLSDVVVADADPVVAEFDFRSLPDTWKNPLFALRVTFQQGDGGTTGNNRFDNFTLTGIPADDANFPPLPVAEIPLVEAIEGGGPAFLDPGTLFTDPEGDALTFSHTLDRPMFASTQTVGGILSISGLRRGEALLVLSADDGINPPVELPVRILVYPAPHVLASGAYSFDGWTADEPELSYPTNMLFLQSGMDDPDAGMPLDHAYFIPHGDYASGDSGTVGFPYNNNSRTRINGLGTSGISFINTGRGRDLGGALLALDTRDAGNVALSWTAGTVTPNSRDYAIRLQYRVGLDGDFADVTDGFGAPFVYHRSPLAGDAADFSAIPLPADALGQPYVQLLWRYHHVSGDSGPRDELRLDDLLVQSDAAPQQGSYAWWRTMHFTPEQQLDPWISGPEADPDGDGWLNFMEFALAGQPWAAGGSLAEAAWTSGQPARPALKFRRPQGISGVTFELLASDDLEEWSRVDDAQWDAFPLGGGIEEIIVSDPQTDGPRRFLRLRVRLEP